MRPIAPIAPLGPQGAEGEPNRAQQWLVPTPLPDRPAHAVLFRPSGEGPFRLALIAHATTQNVLRRAQMPQPEYRALAGFLVARGFAVLVPGAARAMARRVATIWRIRAAATRPTISSRAAPRRTRSGQRWTMRAGSRSFARTGP